MVLAAASIAGADAVLAAGGAHAIAALAYGAGEVPRCDVVVGPGNRWVTEAKRLVSGDVRIDMLAGPSELLVIADDTADPSLVALELVALASSFESDITLRKDGRDANAKSIMSVMMLAASQGSVLEVDAEGADAEGALDALEQLLEERFGEPE